MNKNKEAARVLEHPNGNNRREIATPRVSIVHHPRRDFKRQAAKLVLTVCGLVFLTSIVGIAEGGGLNKRLHEITKELLSMAPGFNAALLEGKEG